MSKDKMPPDWDEAEDGEWDDEYASEQFLAECADLELMTEYLNGRLDAERAAQVRQRLDDDAAFRYLVEPLIILWSIPKHIVRHPRPPGETERAWRDFSRRVGLRT